MDAKKTIVESLEALEFISLQNLLAMYFCTADSARHFTQTRPAFNPIVVEHLQNSVKELFLRTQISPVPNFEFMESITEILDQAKKRVLYLEELSKIRIVLHSLSQYASWLKDTKIMARLQTAQQSDNTADSAVFSTVSAESNVTFSTTPSGQASSTLLLRYPSSVVSQVLNARLARYLDTKGALLRNSLPELKTLDYKKASLQKKRQELAKNFIDSNASICTNKVATIRDGRVVIPINVSYKTKVEGIIHGSSGSSQTVYMEIKSLYEQNNEVEMLDMEEQRIIYKVCTSLSELVAEHVGLIKKEYRNLVEVDVLIAQLQFSRAYEGRFPAIATLASKTQAKKEYTLEKNSSEESIAKENGNGEEIGTGTYSSIYLPEARHPLIKNCVPIDIVYEDDTKELILTGPNAGGKTVALKTLGLLVLMTQSGIPIPVGEDAILPVFEQIGVSIGDHQNIKEGESSFSSQMRLVSAMLPQANSKADTGLRQRCQGGEAPSTIQPSTGANTQPSVQQNTAHLLLFDEFCSGTDDQEGGALAWAILANLLQYTNYFALITTHSTLLKQFALTQAQVQIAALEKHEDAAYTIVYGASGSSESARVARKVGIAPSILTHQSKILQEYGSNTHLLMRKLYKLIKKADANSYKTRKLLTSNKIKKEKLARFEQYLKHRELQVRKQKQGEASTLINDMRALLEKLGDKERQLLKQERLLKEAVQNRIALSDEAQHGAKQQDLELHSAEQHRENTGLPKLSDTGEATKLADLQPLQQSYKDFSPMQSSQVHAIDSLRNESQNLVAQLAEEAKHITSSERTLVLEAEKLSVGDEVQILETGTKGIIIAINGDTQKAIGSDKNIKAHADKQAKESVHKDIQKNANNNIAQNTTYTIRAGIITLTLRRDAIASLQELETVHTYDKDAFANKFSVPNLDKEPHVRKTHYIVERDKDGDAVNNARLSIDLRGYTAQEASEAIHSQLDVAILEKWRSFSIIHGMGSLASAIHRMLGNNDLVASFAFANPEDGGRGKTYVYL